jgi:hypothetical protein
MPIPADTIAEMEPTFRDTGTQIGITLCTTTTVPTTTLTRTPDDTVLATTVSRPWQIDSFQLTEIKMTKHQIRQRLDEILEQVDYLQTHGTIPLIDRENILQKLRSHTK